MTNKRKKFVWENRMVMFAYFLLLFYEWQVSLKSVLCFNKSKIIPGLQRKYFLSEKKRSGRELVSNGSGMGDEGGRG
jgi:hypothetical protein